MGKSKYHHRRSKNGSSGSRHHIGKPQHGHPGILCGLVLPSARNRLFRVEQPVQRKKSYISYRNTRFIVFWSKNPKPLLPYLPILKERGIGCYIQFTLNDYEEDGLETGVPPLTERIETFRTLSDILGKEAVIWRFDPLILTDNISVDTLIEKIERVGTEIHNCTEKLVFSFADIGSYKKVKANMTDSGIPYHEWNKEKWRNLPEN